MKYAIVLVSFLICSFRTNDDEKTATLKFTLQSYQGVQARLIDAMKSIDSIKVVLHFMNADDKINKAADRSFAEVNDVYGFIYQIDTVFRKK